MRVENNCYMFAQKFHLKYTVMKTEVKTHDVLLSYWELKEDGYDQDKLIDKVIGEVSEDELSQLLYGDANFVDDLCPDSTITYKKKTRV